MYKDAHFLPMIKRTLISLMAKLNWPAFQYSFDGLSSSIANYRVVVMSLTKVNAIEDRIFVVQS